MHGTTATAYSQKTDSLFLSAKWGDTAIDTKYSIGAYLGVTLSIHLKFNIHLNKNVAKSYQCLIAFVRRNLKKCLEKRRRLSYISRIIPARSGTHIWSTTFANEKSSSEGLYVLLRQGSTPYNKNYGQCSIFDSWSANNAYIYMTFSANLVYILFFRTVNFFPPICHLHIVGVLVKPRNCI